MKTNFSNLQLINHALIKKDITLLRDLSTGTESFRSAVKRILIILAVEMSKNFNLTKIEIDTPLEKTEGYKVTQEVVLVPVLRAGLGMVNAFLEIIPDAKVGHIGIRRDEDTLKPIEYYFKTPSNINNSIIILLDPMLATGGSCSAAVKYLKSKGAVNCITACLVAAPEGVTKMENDHQDVKIFCAVLDRELNSKGYILPGLGDAGDRTFGTL